MGPVHRPCTCPRNAGIISASFPKANHSMIGLQPRLKDQVYHIVQRGETCDTLTQQLCIHHAYFFSVINYESSSKASCWEPATVLAGPDERATEYPNLLVCEEDMSRRNCWQGVSPGVELCLPNFTALLPPGELCSSFDNSSDSLRCGAANGRRCPYPLCCGASGWCWLGEGFCEQGCQQDYGLCKDPAKIQYTTGLGRCGEDSRLEPGNASRTALKCPQLIPDQRPN